MSFTSPEKKYFLGYIYDVFTLGKQKKSPGLYYWRRV